MPLPEPPKTKNECRGEIESWKIKDFDGEIKKQIDEYMKYAMDNIIDMSIRYGFTIEFAAHVFNQSLTIELNKMEQKDD